MPIKPENKARYPANWKEIRERILRRALHCCEQCSVPNGDIIVRGNGKDAGTYMNNEGKVFDAETGEYLGQWRMSDYCCNGNGVKIVLTIAHLDHVPEHCDEDNLKALCQRCHLAYDAEHHRINAAETRRSRKAIGDLFAAPTEEM
jgi:5-methylcytosine-specific restriction endonuclease McrA